jgi:hypothetical protein
MVLDRKVEGYRLDLVAGRRQEEGLVAAARMSMPTEIMDPNTRAEARAPMAVAAVAAITAVVAAPGLQAVAVAAT